MVYRDRQDLNINIKGGASKRSGSFEIVQFRAGYAQCRHRQNRHQQDFMKLLQSSSSKPKHYNLPEIIRIITENTETNLTVTNITYFAEAFEMQGGDINFHTMPADKFNKGHILCLRSH